MKWSKAKPPKLAPGTPIEVHWVDVVGSVTGSPKDAKPAYTTTLGYFLCYKKVGNRRCLLTSLNLYPNEVGETMGYDVYPLEYITDVKEMCEKTPPPTNGGDAPHNPSNVDTA